MPFAPVKSDPWKKGKRRRRKRARGWDWKKLVEQAWEDHKAGYNRKRDQYPISPACLALIRWFNESVDEE